MPVFAPPETDGIINSTIEFVVQDDQNEMKCDFFIHLTLSEPVSASCDANGIVYSTIAFIMSR